MATMKGAPAKTVAEAYGDAQTAIAMAKGEAWQLRERLRLRAVSMRAEADAIDAFLETSTKRTDSWYDEILARHDASRLKSDD